METSQKIYEISEHTSLEESRIYRTLSISQSERKKLNSVHAGILNMKGRGLACQEIWDRVCDVRGLRQFKKTCEGYGNPSITISPDNKIAITLSKEIEKIVEKPTTRAEKSYCKVSGKRIYSAAGARRSLRQSLENDNGYRPLRMYSCEYCGKHHLSSNLP